MEVNKKSRKAVHEKTTTAEVKKIVNNAVEQQHLTASIFEEAILTAKSSKVPNLDPFDVLLDNQCTSSLLFKQGRKYHSRF
jgi:hypothetical protein